MTASRTLLPFAGCSGCRDVVADARACAGCEPLTVEGTPDAVAACLVRLSDQGWRVRTEQVEVGPSRWRTRVAPPRQLVGG